MSCRKTDLPAAPKQPVEHQVNLSYVDNFESSNYELIVTDSNGKFLLDTILPTNQTATVKFLYNEPKVNITTIELSEDRYYNEKTYK